MPPRCANCGSPTAPNGEKYGGEYYKYCWTCTKKHRADKQKGKRTEVSTKELLEENARLQKEISHLSKKVGEHEGKLRILFGFMDHQQKKEIKGDLLE